MFSASCSKMRSMRSQEVKQTISKTPSSLGYFSSEMASWWYLEARCASTLRRTSALATAKSVRGWLSSRLKMGLPLEPQGRSSSKMSLNSSQMQWLKEKQPGRKYSFFSTSRSNSSILYQLKQGACSWPSPPSSERLVTKISSSVLRMYLRMSMGRHWKGSFTCLRKHCLQLASMWSSSRTTTDRTYSFDDSVGLLGSEKPMLRLITLLSTSQEQVVMKLWSRVLLLRMVTQKSSTSACSTSSTSRSFLLRLSLTLSSRDSELMSSLILTSLWKLPSQSSRAASCFRCLSISCLNSWALLLRAGWSSERSRMLRSWRMFLSLSLCSVSSLMIYALKLSMSSCVSFRKGSNYTLRSPSCFQIRLQKSDRLMFVERLKAVQGQSACMSTEATYFSLMAGQRAYDLGWFSKEMGDRNLREDLSLFTERASLDPLYFRITSFSSYQGLCFATQIPIGSAKCFKKSCSETELFWLLVMIESNCRALRLPSTDLCSLAESSKAFSCRLAQFWLRYSMSTSILYATCGSFFKFCSSDSIMPHFLSCSLLNNSTFRVREEAADSSRAMASEREWKPTSSLRLSQKLDLMCRKGHSAFLPSCLLASSFRSRFSSKQEPLLSENSVLICGTFFLSLTLGSSVSCAGPAGQRKGSGFERLFCIFFFMVFLSQLVSCLLYLISLSATSKRFGCLISFSGLTSRSVLSLDLDLDFSLERDLFYLAWGNSRFEMDLLKCSLSWVERQVFSLEIDLDFSFDLDLDLECSKRMGEVVSSLLFPSLFCDFLWKLECLCDYLDLQYSECCPEAALGLLHWLFSSFLAFFFSGVPLALPGEPFFGFLGFLEWASAALALPLSSFCLGFLVTSMKAAYIFNELFILQALMQSKRGTAGCRIGGRGLQEAMLVNGIIMI